MNDDPNSPGQAPSQPSGQQVPQSALNQAQGLVHGSYTIQPLTHDQATPTAPTRLPAARLPAGGPSLGVSGLPDQPTRSFTETNLSAAPVSVQAAVASTLYPTVPEHGTLPSQQGPMAGSVFVTGSQMPIERPKLPLGIYVIAGLNIVSFVAIFLDDYKAGTVYAIVMLVNLLLAIGLLLRQDIIRRVYIGLSLLSIGLVILAFIGIADTRSKLDALRANYDATASRMNTSNLTPDQKAELQLMPQLIDEVQKKNDKLFTVAYIRLGAEAVVALTCVVYVTRPKVRAAFTQLPV